MHVSVQNGYNLLFFSLPSLSSGFGNKSLNLLVDSSMCNQHTIMASYLHHALKKFRLKVKMHIQSSSFSMNVWCDS